MLRVEVGAGKLRNIALLRLRRAKPRPQTPQVTSSGGGKRVVTEQGPGSHELFDAREVTRPLRPPL